jgi:hypothetical protein
VLHDRPVRQPDHDRGLEKLLAVSRADVVGLVGWVLLALAAIVLVAGLTTRCG